MSAVLNLEDIMVGLPGLTKISGGHLLEGCITTLYRKNHSSGVLLKVIGDNDLGFKVIWPDLYNDQLDRTWKDQIYATEQAAVCIALLLAIKLTGYTVIERSVRKTGFDYWLGESDGILFQKKARLEVSGIFNSNLSLVTKRFNGKCIQTEQSDSSGFPAYISISGFTEPIARFGIKP